MMLCGKTGAVLLYGTKCAGCDCGGGRSLDELERISPRMTREAKAHLDRHPPGTVHMGFDLASKPDKSASYRIHRVGDEYSYFVDDIEFMEMPSGVAEQMAEFARRQREAMEDAILGHKRWQHAGDSRSRHWGRAPYRQPIEIITDPADRRGFDAKRIGGTST